METLSMNTSSDTGVGGDHIRVAVAAAIADVDALNLRDEDRKVVLTAVLQARLPASPAQTTNSGSSPAPPQHSQVPTPVISAPTDDAIGKIGAVLKVDRDVLDLVYAMQDGEPHVVVSPKKIAQNKAQGARELAQLLAAARQTSGLEEWTSVGTIRKVVTDYGRLDSANFATAIQQMDKVALIRGKGQQREVKITKPGLENTAELIQRLAGAEG
jgi:hypothetical protein